jgi:sodium/proline symporter
MSGILAATMSSSDSYLLIASSALSRDIFKGIFKKDATDKQVMLVSRITLLLVSLFGIIIALDENSVIFKVVSFAWAGFGATFGPIHPVLIVLEEDDESRCNRRYAHRRQYGIHMEYADFASWRRICIYELFPAFVLSCIAIVIVSCPRCA